MASSSHQYDIIIVGAALVGASAALALAKKGFKVALVDRKLPVFAAENAEVWDSRIYAISPGNADWLKDLGVWQTINADRIAPIHGMQIWGDAGGQALAFTADEALAESLGFIIENTTLHQALWSALSALDVDVLVSECAAIDLNEHSAHLSLANGTQLSAKLLIGADGGNSWVRLQAGLSQQKTTYQQVGVVANFEVELAHENIARQWFLEDGILAWLPLSGKRISMVFSSKNAQDLMAMSPPALSEFVAQTGGHLLGEMRMITPAAAFPLVKQNASALIAHRLVLVGDAAHQVHPMAGQGVNLGFRDVVELVQVLGQRHPLADIGDHFVLRRYERARKADVLAMQGLTHGLYGAFDSKQALIKAARNWGLTLPNRYPLLKRVLMAQAVI